MSAPDRRQLVDRTGGVLSIRRQCELLGIARSGLYRSPSAANDDLALMRRIDELFIAWPFLGSRRMTTMLRAEGHAVNRKRIRRLMARDGHCRARPEAAYHEAGTGTQDIPVSAARSGHRSTESSLVRRHHLHSDRPWLPLPRSDHGLGEPGSAGLATVQHHGLLVLRLGAGGGTGALRKAEHLQHGPGQPVHVSLLHRRPGRAPDPISMDGRGLWRDTARC
jgi:putative transposase